ncbi:hypothetical protein J6590_046632, partial [Homalodisca vitripennis]
PIFHRHSVRSSGTTPHCTVSRRPRTRLRVKPEVTRAVRQSQMAMVTRSMTLTHPERLP